VDIRINRLKVIGVLAALGLGLAGAVSGANGANGVGLVGAGGGVGLGGAGAAVCSGPVTEIPAVQGSGDTAAVTGAVTVRGVVVGDFEGPQPALRGFYLQELKGDGDPATSDGIFVFEGAAGVDAVTVGQLVEVTGTAGEFQGQTQVTSAAVTICSAAGASRATEASSAAEASSTREASSPPKAAKEHAARTPAPVNVRLPVASVTALERYEGMLVRLPQRLTVTEHFQLGRFGQVVVSSGGRLRQPTAKYRPTDPRAAALQARNELNQLVVDDATNAQNPDPIGFARGRAPVGRNVLTAANTLRGGDTVTNAIGVLTYTWGGNAAGPNAYRLRPIGALGGAARFVAGNPRPSGTPSVGGSLRVASSNLLNYFDSFNAPAGSGCTFGVGGAAADCRGAESPLELERQAAKEVAALTSLKADVVGVMEIENDGYGADSAIADLVARLNAATAPGTWAYIDPDQELGRVNAAGTDAIKVAMLYRPAAVSPVRGTTQVFAEPNVFERDPLAQTFAGRAGGAVTVVVNHWKSKGCDGATGADVDAGDGQGCFNARRSAQASALAGWLRDTVVPTAKDPDVLVIGDLNSYAQEDPIAALRSAGYRDLIAAEGAPNPYSYVFDGQWGYLDHALAGRSLRKQVTGAADVHINADEPSVLDYNVNFRTPGQVGPLYAPDRFRTSDHDPVVIGLRLTR
jgi:predicted extracellular nuclease